jgi:hypothetical protein
MASRFLEIFTPLQYMTSKFLHETGPDGVWLLVSNSLWYALACFKTDEDLSPCVSDSVLQCLL